MAAPSYPRREGRLTLSDFARLLGTSARELSRTCSVEIASHDFRYRFLSRPERDATILRVLGRIASPELTVAGDEGARGRWESGWKENLSEFKGDNDLAKLVPKYFRRGQPLRLFREYVYPLDKDFELHWLTVLRHWLFEKYLKEVDSVYEFGCGTGHNLVALAETFPDKTLYGLDWSRSSVRLVNTLSRVYGWKMRGLPFNISSPDGSLKIGGNSAVITFSALEQMGRDHEKFLRFLLKKKPTICIHIEPVVEWYDEGNLLDYLAVLFHRRRGYLEGFVPRLTKLKSEGRVELTELRRSFFGSMYTDGYSQVIWRPTTHER